MLPPPDQGRQIRNSLYSADSSGSTRGPGYEEFEPGASPPHRDLHREYSPESPRSVEGDMSGDEHGEDQVAKIVRSISESFRLNQLPLIRIAVGVLMALMAYVLFLLCFVPGLQPGQCGSTLCPKDWAYSATGGYFCEETKGCRPGEQGPFPVCETQCWIGNVPTKNIERTTQKHSTVPKPGYYDLRMQRDGKMVGCMAPISKFPGDPRYGCGPPFNTASKCDAAANPIRDTQYVDAVHRGCATEIGKGTYGYAFDDGVGLKQCPPMTLYEWILCPTGNEEGSGWSADDGPEDSKKRFRVTNHCSESIWIQSAGNQLPFDSALVKIEPGESYAYSVPVEGVPSTRFLPKTGCDEHGNNCDVQSVPPCPAEGCSPPIDTKFEASFGCVLEPENITQCTKTGQGLPSTYQDWWDGSAVDGWTLPFSIYVNDGGWSLAPGVEGSSSQCKDVLCPGLKKELCPKREWLTPETEDRVMLS